VYVGRIVAVGKTSAGANAVMYRVSSRSFPNRTAIERAGKLVIIPRPGHEVDLVKNPYISYTCLCSAGSWAVASNGSQTDAIAEKIAAGVPARDALVTVLLALDYERDEYATPRIAAAVPLEGESAWLAIVRRDALVAREVQLERGRARYLATYGADDIREENTAPFDAQDALSAARTILSGPGFRELERPVVAAIALAQPCGFALVALDALDANPD
jgi:IMP cyclohydrolase